MGPLTDENKLQFHEKSNKNWKNWIILKKLKYV